MYAVYTLDQNGEKVVYTTGTKEWCNDIASELDLYGARTEVVDLGPAIPEAWEGDPL